MDYRQDWLLRQIEMMTQLITRVVFHKDVTGYEIKEESNLFQTDKLYRDIEKLLAERKICEAEDLLYESLDINDRKYLELAVYFYQKINFLGDEELERCNFPREEIKEGLDCIIKMFGLQDVVADC